MIDAYLVSMNTVTAFAYFCLTHQLFCLTYKAQHSNVLGQLQASTDEKKQRLAHMVNRLCFLFIAFISLCGFTHALEVLAQATANIAVVVVIQRTILALCAVVSIVTALVGYQFFPIIGDLLAKFELNDEGKLQHIENYLHEVVELVKESVLLLSEDMVVLRTNEASKSLFGRPTLVGEKLTDCIHPDDLKVFQNTVMQTMSAYSNEHITLEYRVLKSTLPPVSTNTKSSPKHSFSLEEGFPPPKRGFSRSMVSSSTMKIYADRSDRGGAVAPRTPSSISLSGAARVSSDTGDSTSERDRISEQAEYVWVESAMCKGMRLTASGDFEYDVKMVTRNIDERKKQAQSQLELIVRESQEQARINAAKLRYISCIAHDLKTPLQSFCFSLDLLQQTALQNEQWDLVQQANVAVDLMKLTISQTMDISKALSGGKIVPHCATVFLSSVIARVKVIINGYGKQVPIAFDISPRVCDAVITDEEWLWQMLLNLLTNACKYTDKGGITVTIKVDPDIALPIVENVATYAALLFEVADTGVGVQADKIGHIFDAFSQVQAGQVTGTGLGLFGVRTRAEGLHGTCGARHNTASPTGTGTVIWFAIPYQADKRSLTRSGTDSTPLSISSTAGSRIASVSSQGSSSQATSESAKIAAAVATVSANPIQERQLTAIVVDDTLTVRKLMEKLLLKLGFARVDCYENGSKGLDAMMAGQVDIVFTDVQMPIMTGPEMTARFRKWEAEALQSGARTVRQVIVAVTANGAQVGEPGHFDQICLKPLSSSEIQRVVQYFMSD